jgi:hypothetical protein
MNGAELGKIGYICGYGEWTNQAFAEKLLHPLLILAVFVVRFLAIYTLQDVNDRMSRSGEVVHTAES